MRVKNSSFTALVFFFIYFGICYGEFLAKNVVIVVGDQFRLDESFGDKTHQNIPRLWNDLVPIASRCVTFYGNPSYMALVHLAILTGSWKDLRRANPEDNPQKPTIFEYFRKGLGKDKKSCYFITSKHEFNFMTWSYHPEYGEEYGATEEFTQEKNNDKELVSKLISYMKTNRPQLIVAILGGAHSFNKKQLPEDMVRYRRQLKEMDENIYKIWEAIQTDSAYKDKTNFFFLNDHGDILLQQDCDDECKRYLVILAMGPDIKKNYSTQNKWRQINICPTVGRILGFPTPYVDKDATFMEDFFITGGK